MTANVSDKDAREAAEEVAQFEKRLAKVQTNIAALNDGRHQSCIDARRIRLGAPEAAALKRRRRAA